MMKGMRPIHTRAIRARPNPAIEQSDAKEGWAIRCFLAGVIQFFASLKAFSR